MTLIALLVDKLLRLVGLNALAEVESSTVVLFIILAAIELINGLFIIIKKRPIRKKKYSEYTPESVRKASFLLGITDILVCIFDIFVGVLKFDTVPNMVIYVGSAVSLVVSTVISVIATRKLEKKA